MLLVCDLYNGIEVLFFLPCLMCGVVTKRGGIVAELYKVANDNCGSIVFLSLEEETMQV